MPVISAYFIPATKFSIGQFENRVKSGLARLKLIDGWYDEDDKTYASGRELMFEYASTGPVAKC